MNVTYQRKQSLVTAIQWYPHIDSQDVYKNLHDTTAVLVTSSGTFVIRPGDWILEANGQKWIVEQGVFDLLYEPTETS